MSHLPLDARAILHYLNELGYRNISAEQLREFLKDLRKLIKYDERLAQRQNQDDHFAALFERTTASYRAKINKENESYRVKSGKENVPTEVGEAVFSPPMPTTSSKPSLITKPPSETATTTTKSTKIDQMTEQFRKNLQLVPVDENINKNAVRVQRSTKRTSDSVETLDSARPRSRSQQRARSKNRKKGDGVPNRKAPKCDPVALFHYYQREWEFFRNQIPGENAHMDLRWQIRHKFSNIQP